MIYFCPNCWKEIDKDAVVCPYCKADIRAIDRKDYISKLIHALNHPEPETPIRAAEILGNLKVKEAIPELTNLVENNNDLYIKEAGVKALSDIGDKSIIPILKKWSLQNQPLIVRIVLEDALQKLA